MGFRLGDTESAPSESVMGLPRETQVKEVHIEFNMIIYHVDDVDGKSRRNSANF